MNKVEIIENLKREVFENSQKQYISEYVKVGDFSYGVPKVYSWGEGAKLKIGKFCSIAEGVGIMLGGEHRIDWVTTYPFNALMGDFSEIKGHPKTKGDVIIGNDVWLAGHCKIMSGVTIGNGCVVAANAIVTKDMPQYTIWGGNPAKFIKFRFSKKEIKKLQEMQWWDWKYEFLYDGIKLLQNNSIEALWKYYINMERKKIIK